MPEVRSTIRGEKKTVDVLSPDVIAVAYNTVPRFTKYTDFSVDILTEWVDRNIESGDLDFPGFFQSVTSVFPNVTEQEVLKLWITRNPQLATEGSVMFYVQMTVGSMLDVETFAKYDVGDFLASIDNEVDILRKRIRKEKKDLDILSGNKGSMLYLLTQYVKILFFFSNYLPKNINLVIN